MTQLDTNPVGRVRVTLEDERRAFVRRRLDESLPGGLSRQTAVAPDPGLMDRINAEWRSELVARRDALNASLLEKVGGLVEQRLKINPGEAPEAFAQRKLAAVQELAQRRGLTPPRAPDQVVGPVSMADEAARSMQRFAMGTLKIPGNLLQMAGSVGPDALTRAGVAMNAGVDAYAPPEGIQPSQQVQQQGALPDSMASVPRWLAARGPEAAMSLATSIIPGAAVGRALGAGAGVGAAIAAGTAQETSGAFEESLAGLMAQGVAEPEARKRAAAEAAVYGAVSGVLEKFPAAEFVLKNREARGLLTRLARGAFVEGSTESAQELAQALTQVVGGSAPDAMQGIGERMAASGILGGLVGGVAGAGGAGPAAGAPAAQSNAGQTTRTPPPGGAGEQSERTPAGGPSDQGTGSAAFWEAEAEMLRQAVASGAADPNNPRVQGAMQFIQEQLAAANRTAGVDVTIPTDSQPTDIQPPAPVEAPANVPATPPASGEPGGAAGVAVPLVVPTQGVPDAQTEESPGRAAGAGGSLRAPGNGTDGSGQRDDAAAADQPQGGVKTQRATATSTAPTAVTPVSPPAPPPAQVDERPRPAKPSEFSRAQLVREILEGTAGMADATDAALNPEMRAMRAQGGSTQTIADVRKGTTSTEVREGFSGATPMERAFAPSEDVLSDVYGGEVSEARRSAEYMASGKAGRLRRAREQIVKGGAESPQAVVAEYELSLLEEYGNARKGVTLVPRPERLPAGTTFAINGVTHEISRDENGVTTFLAQDMRRTIPLNGVDVLRVDTGSLDLTGQNRGDLDERLQTAQAAGVADDLPFTPRTGQRASVPDSAYRSVAAFNRSLRERFGDEGPSITIVEPQSRADKQAVAVAKRLGITPVFFAADGQVGTEGFVDPAGDRRTVFLEAGQDADNVRRVTSHEWVHSLRRTDPEAFDRLVEAIERVQPGALAQAVGEYRRMASATPINLDRLNAASGLGLEEAVATLFTLNAGKAGYWSALAGETASVWERVVDALRRVLTRIGLSGPVARELLRTVERATADSRKASSQAAPRTGEPVLHSAKKRGAGVKDTAPLDFRGDGGNLTGAQRSMFDTAPRGPQPPSEPTKTPSPAPGTLNADQPRREGETDAEYRIRQKSRKAEIATPMMFSPKRGPSQGDFDAAADRKGQAGFGRPDLANPGLDPATRETIDVLDEIRKAMAVPEIDNRRIEAQAAEMLKDEKAVLRAMEQRVRNNTAPNAADVTAAKMLANNEANRLVLGQTDVAKAYRTIDAYRTEGTNQSVAFAARRDPVRSVGMMAFNAVGRELVEPSPTVARSLKRIDKVLRDPKSTDAKRKQALDEKAKIDQSERDRIFATIKVLQSTGQTDRLAAAEKIAKQDEAAMNVASLAVTEENRKITSELMDLRSERTKLQDQLLKAHGQLADLKGDAKSVKADKARLEKQAAELNTRLEEARKEEARLRNLRADIARREAAMASKMIDWANGQGIDAGGITVRPAGQGDAQSRFAPIPGGPDPKRMNYRNQQDLKGNENAGALSIIGTPDVPRAQFGDVKPFSTGLQKNVPGLDAVYDGGDVKPFDLMNQMLVVLPDGRTFRAGEFFQKIQEPAKSFEGTDGLKGATGTQRVYPIVDIQRAMASVRMMKDATIWDKAVEWYRNSILSGIKTLSINLFSTQFHALAEVYGMRALKAAINQSPAIFGKGPIDPDGPRFGEYRAMMRATSKAYARAASGMARTWNTEIPVFEAEVDLYQKLSRGEKPDGENDDVSYMNPAAIAGAKGRMVRTPQRVLAATDEMNMAWITTLEVAARAYRVAENEGLKGEAAWDRVDDLMGDLSHPIWGDSIDEARRIAFKTPAKELGPVAGALASAVLRARRKIRDIPHIGPMLHAMAVIPTMPFVTTPANIAVTTVANTPLVTLRAGYRATRSFLDRGKAGGFQYTPEMKLDDAARNTLVWGTMAAVMGLLVAGGDDEPWITGSRLRDIGLAEQMSRGAKPYSIRVPFTGKYVTYERLEPFAGALAFMVDTINAWRDAETVGDSTRKMATSVKNIVIDKTYLSNIGDIFELVTSVGDGGSLKRLQDFGANYVSSWTVPNLVRATLRDTDDNLREFKALGPQSEHGFWGGMAAKTLYRMAPLAALAPPPKHDLWGRPVTKANNAGPVLTPFVRALLPVEVYGLPDDKARDLDRLISNWNDANPGKKFKPRAPEPYFTSKGEKVPMTTREYADFTREAGEAAAKRLLAMRLNVERPGEREYKALETEVAKARRDARKKLWERRTAVRK